MDKLFSIIVPTYNVEKKIAKTLDSVIAQDKELYECIIVDGNSTDNTVKIVEEYKKKFPENITYISEPDKGIYDAMNKGIDLAQGEYLYFLGAGDMLRTDILKQVKLYLNFEKELVYGQVFQKKWGYKIFGIFDKAKICFIMQPHQATFYHRSIFSQLGKYTIEYDIAGDYEFNLRCFGDNRVKKRYIDLVIADFEGGGIGNQALDKKFEQDKCNIILKYLGKKYYNLYNSASCKVWLNENFVKLMKYTKNIDVIIFGAGNFGKNVFKYLNELKDNKINIKYFMDNNQLNWGKEIYGVQIIKPEIGIINKVDKIVIASMPGKVEIQKQLLSLGVREEKIISAV